jgi:lysyl-tRNA synthetase class 2
MVVEQPYSFKKDYDLKVLREKYDSPNLKENSYLDLEVSVAGRIQFARRQGAISFLKIKDWTGEIQIFGQKAMTEQFEDFCKLSLGDWIGVEGPIHRTKRGEFSVAAKKWVVLAKAKTTAADKYHGLNDPDIIYRHRELDLFSNSESMRIFLTRSKIVSFIRSFLNEKGFVEVETPMLNAVASGAIARPFITHHNALDHDFYLRIAPELYLKRTVVGGFEKVFELSRVFRNEGLSPRHNPEFTLLELYQAYADYFILMDLTEDLVSRLALHVKGSMQFTYQGRQLDLTPPWPRKRLEDLVKDYTGYEVGPHIELPILRRYCDELSIEYQDNWGPGKLTLEIYEKTVESKLWGPIFVTDYPKEVSPLARTHRDSDLHTERFEAIICFRELANAFSELTDPEEQKSRFNAELEHKKAGDKEAMGYDKDYIKALEFGLPPTAGLGIGIDRLVMLLTDQDSIRDVILFPTLKPLENDD